LNCLLLRDKSNEIIIVINTLQAGLSTKLNIVYIEKLLTNLYKKAGLSYFLKIIFDY
jgi:hypothetical protein